MDFYMTSSPFWCNVYMNLKKLKENNLFVCSVISCYCWLPFAGIVLLFSVIYNVDLYCSIRVGSTTALQARDKNVCKISFSSICCNARRCSFLGALAKSRKKTVSFDMSVCPSICSHGTTRLPLDVFLWNLILSIFLICRENSSFIRTGTLHDDWHIFLSISCSVLLKMKDVSDKSCRENENTHFVFSNFFNRAFLR